MIPFATPTTGEVINLSQIVRVTVQDANTILVAFSDGTKRNYTGDAAKFINLEVHFALNMYRQFQIDSQRTIIDPNAPEARLM